jgi:hypothetical protein
MAADERTANKDPSQATADSPSSSPVKKKKKPSATAPEFNKTGGDLEKDKKQKTKKETPKTSTQPASVLKTGKLGSGYRLSFADEAPQTKAPHDHKHKRVIVEINEDLAAESLNQFEGDNNKKAVYAIQQLVVNLMIADKHAVLHHAEDPSMESTIGGAGGNAVPTPHQHDDAQQLCERVQSQTLCKQSFLRVSRKPNQRQMPRQSYLRMDHYLMQ